MSKITIVPKRKGQAALEFLTTYGWALLVILVMIGAISYFGIMNPTKFIPARCTSSPEFSCVDYKIGSDSKVAMVMKQSVGKTIYFKNITCQYNDVVSTSAGSVPATNTKWEPKKTQSVNCTLPASTLAPIKGEKVKITYDIVYEQTLNSGLTHVASGDVFAEVQ